MTPNNRIPENAQNVKTFDGLKRAYENAHFMGLDTSAELMELAQAVAYSVVNKCLDPQRKTATEHVSISDNGFNPALNAMRRGIKLDLDLLDKARNAINAASRISYNGDGDATTETVNKAADEAAAALMAQTLSDGIDLVQAAALAIWEQTAEHATAPGWLDMPYTFRKLSKRVLIKDSDSAAYKDIETTPIQEVYKAVRRAIQSSRAVQTDPANMYSYIEDYATDDINGLEIIYRRLGKCADMGGYDCNGNYTTDRQTATDIKRMIEEMQLTARQAQILKMRMQGIEISEIAIRLKVNRKSIYQVMYAMQDKAAALGYAPRGWTEHSREDAVDVGKPVIQMSMNGEWIATYASAAAAMGETGINKGSISYAAAGKRLSAGGYKWAYLD